jgi:hypothetical protein
MGQISLPMGMFTLVSTSLASQMAMDSINGLMETLTQACFQMVSSMAKENGKRNLQLKVGKVTVMKANIYWIRKTGMVYLNGRVATFLKVNMLMMKETASEKCLGLMEAFIRDNG